MVNGMSGNAIKYFIDGIPMESMGNGMTVGSLPAALIERIEIYKGVIPAWLGGDILGGAVNVVTRPDKRNYIDATLSIGSFHTFGTNINGRWAAKPGAPIIKAAFSLSKSKNDYLMKDVEVWDEDSRKYVRVNRRRFHDDYLLATALLEIEWKTKAGLTPSISQAIVPCRTNNFRQARCRARCMETHHGTGIHSDSVSTTVNAIS